MQIYTSSTTREDADKVGKSQSKELNWSPNSWQSRCTEGRSSGCGEHWGRAEQDSQMKPDLWDHTPGNDQKGNPEAMLENGWGRKRNLTDKHFRSVLLGKYKDSELHSKTLSQQKKIRKKWIHIKSTSWLSISSLKLTTDKCLSWSHWIASLGQSQVQCSNQAPRGHNRGPPKQAMLTLK